MLLSREKEGGEIEGRLDSSCDAVDANIEQVNDFVRVVPT